MNWFGISLASMGLYGIQAFLFKVAADRKCNSSLVMFFFMLTAGSLALISYSLIPTPVLDYRIFLIYAISQVVFYLLRQISKIEAMKFIPGIVVLPITAFQGMVAALLGIFILFEKITMLQFFGILLAFLAIVILSREKEEKIKPKHFKLGIILAISAAVLGGITNFITKLAAANVDKFLFTGVSYYFALLPLYFFQKSDIMKTKTKKMESVKLGIYSGVVNFAAFILFLMALVQGPMSVVVPLVDLGLLFAVILIVVIYKEKLTLSRIVGILLAILAVFLLKG